MAFAAAVLGCALSIPDASAATYTGATCNSGGGTGPDGQNYPADSNPTDGSSTWSNVVGCNASGGGYSGVQVMGAYAQAKGNGAVSMGFAAVAFQNGVAYGLQAVAGGQSATAIGQWTRALGDGSVAIGGNNSSNSAASGAQAFGTNAIAIGGQSNSAGSQAIAIGLGSSATQSDDIAIGAGAATNADSNGNNIAIGNGVTTGANGRNVAMGSGGTTANAGSGSGGAVAIGVGQKASGNGAVAIGDPNTANGTGAVALGANNTAAGSSDGSSAANGAVAIGNANEAVGQGSVALGNGSRAETAGALAFGDTANAQARNAIALGANSSATSAGSVALGANALANGSTLGNAAYNPGAGTLSGTSPVGEASVGSSGNERRITNVAAGAAATDAVNVSQLQSLGGNVSNLGNSTASALGGGVSYDASTGNLTNPTYNIAGGTQNTVSDAINALNRGWNLTTGGNTSGSSTTAVQPGSTVTFNGGKNIALTQNGANITIATSDVPTFTSVGIDNGGPTLSGSGLDMARQKITNVAAGAAATDAVNVSQLQSVSGNVNNLGNSTASALGGGVSYDASTGNLTNPTYNIAGGTQNTVSDAINALNRGWNLTTSGNTSGSSTTAVQPGSTVTFDGGRNIALTQNGANITIATSDVPTFTSVGIDNGGPTLSGSGLDMARQKITNVAAGDVSPNSADAVNGSQLYQLQQAGQQANERAVKYDVAPDGSINYTSVTLGGPTSTDGGLTGGTKITNLAQGMLSPTSTDAVNGAQLYQTNQNVSNLSNQVSSIANGGGIKYFHANGGTSAPLPDSQANGAGSTAMGPSAAANGANSVAIGNGATAQQNGDVALGAGSVANRGAQSYIGQYSGARNDTVGTVSVGAPGAQRTISNVADGVEATDAVNVRQLDGAVQTANAYTDQQVRNVNQSVITENSQLQQIGTRISNVERAAATEQNGAAGMFQVNQGSPTNAPQASGSNATAGGSGAVASGASSTALGNGAQASGTNSVALGAGSVADRDNTVSVASPGRERQITNVAAGTMGTDAVNLNQLNAAVNQTASQLQRGINQTARNAYSGVAAATALTMIPDVDKDKTISVGIGVGAFQGYQAVALGATARVTENIKLRAGLSQSSSGSAFGVGASMQW